MKKLIIKTDPSYPILLEEGLLENLGFHVKKLRKDSLSGKKCLIITDTTVKELYLTQTRGALEKEGLKTLTFAVAPGESSKSLRQAEEILNFLVNHQITKEDLLISLGGGVVGDLTGFVASIYHRGCPYVQIPTTLLAMVDASIGGKTAVNLEGGKNLAGAFWQPQGVFMDPLLLSTLSQQEKLNGMAEVIKSSIIGDSDLLEEIRQKPHLWEEDIPLSWIIRAVTVKKNLVEQDEKDQGLRQLLNLGHTIGHSLEHLSGFSQPHGFCVAQGMVAIARLSYQAGWTQENLEPMLRNLLSSMGFPLDWDYSTQQIFDSLTTDKKSTGKEIALIIPFSIGNCQRYSIPLEELKKKMEEIF